MPWRRVLQSSPVGRGEGRFGGLPTSVVRCDRSVGGGPPGYVTVIIGSLPDVWWKPFCHQKRELIPQQQHDLIPLGDTKYPHLWRARTRQEPPYPSPRCKRDTRFFWYKEEPRFSLSGVPSRRRTNNTGKPTIRKIATKHFTGPIHPTRPVLRNVAT